MGYIFKKMGKSSLKLGKITPRMHLERPKILESDFKTPKSDISSQRYAYFLPFDNMVTTKREEPSLPLDYLSSLCSDQKTSQAHHCFEFTSRPKRVTTKRLGAMQSL